MFSRLRASSSMKFFTVTTVFVAASMALSPLEAETKKFPAGLKGGVERTFIAVKVLNYDSQVSQTELNDPSLVKLSSDLNKKATNWLG